MRRLASGVAIIVAQGEDGPIGMAATSITSLTMDAPALLVCVNRSASLHACLAPGCPIGVNLLSRDQRDVSAAFGGAVPRAERFRTGHWTSPPQEQEGGQKAGLPMLEDAQANLDCTIDAIMPYGTHSIVIARVEAVRLSAHVAPLIYQDGAYL
jgi:flavin reductase (DIM6/NTAB) family NADH-FMN oxidoreductase RutF